MRHHSYNKFFDKAIEEANRRFTVVYSAMGWMIAGTIATGIYAASAANTAGKTQKSMYEQQAANKRVQAMLAQRTADENAAANTIQASEEAKMLATKAGAVAGAGKATAGAQGVGGGSVTAADIASSNYDKAKLDEIAIRYNADSKNASLMSNKNNQVWGLNSEATQYDAAGVNAVKEAEVKETSTLLNTATSVAGTIGDSALTTAYKGKKIK